MFARVCCVCISQQEREGRPGKDAREIGASTGGAARLAAGSPTDKDTNKQKQDALTADGLDVRRAPRRLGRRLLARLLGLGRLLLFRQLLGQAEAAAALLAVLLEVAAQRLAVVVVVGCFVHRCVLWRRGGRSVRMKAGARARALLFGPALGVSPRGGCPPKHTCTARPPSPPPLLLLPIKHPSSPPPPPIKRAPPHRAAASSRFSRSRSSAMRRKRASSSLRCTSSSSLPWLALYVMLCGVVCLVVVLCWRCLCISGVNTRRQRALMRASGRGKPSDGCGQRQEC